MTLHGTLHPLVLIRLWHCYNKLTELPPGSTPIDLYKSSTPLKHLSKTVMSTHIYLSFSTFQSSSISDTFYSSPLPLFILYLPASLLSVSQNTSIHLVPFLSAALCPSTAPPSSLGFLSVLFTQSHRFSVCQILY